MSHFTADKTTVFDYSSGDYRNLKKIEPPFSLPWSTVTYLRGENIYNKIKQFISKETLSYLDYGGYNGLTAFRLNQSLKLEGTIADLDQNGLKIARAIGFDTINLKDNKLQKGKYDLVTCNHVLEHLIHPSKTIAEIYEAMKNENSILYIEVPNINGFPYSDEAHLTTFSIRGIEEFLHINRFNIVDIGYTTSPKIAADFGYNFVSDIENIYAIARPVRQSQNVQKK